MALVKKMLEIPIGCRGMTGSFDYERKHYELNKKIGEIIIFPIVGETAPEAVLSTTGTSCRHHIEEATGRKISHPIDN